MKFTMFKKETTDKKYHENFYRAGNFEQDEAENLICPNGRKFIFNRIFDVVYEETPDPAFTRTGVSQLMTFLQPIPLFHRPKLFIISPT